MERAFEQWKSKEVARLLALVETERRYYQELVANLPVSVAVLNTDYSLVAANRIFRQSFGVISDDMRRRRIGEILSSTELQARIQSVFESGIASRPIVVERTLPTSAIPQRLRVSIQAIRDWDEDSGLQALLVIEDMAEFTTPALPAPQEPAAMPAPLPCVVWTARISNKQFTLVSPSAKALLGIDPKHWIHSPSAFADRIHSDDRARTISFYDQSIASPGFHSAEFRIGQGVQSVRETILADPAGDLMTGVITDISTRRAVEEQMLQAQRFEAAGFLAGRLAHDINNPLMIVNGYAEELALSFPAGDPRAADMREIQNAGKRIGDLTAHLQSVTRKQTVTTHPVNVHTELSKVVDRMRAAAGQYLQAEYRPGTESLTVLAETGQLEAVLLELSAALVEGGGESAHLILSANPAQVSELIRPDQPLPPGHYVELSILNRSQGAPSLPDRLFESLLPTKDAGPALARTYKTVQDWGGTIQPVSGANEIRVYLKAASAPVTAPPPESQVAPVENAPPQPPPPPTPRKTTILIVEDEPGIRALMRKILQREDFSVLEAGSGAEALELLKQKGPADLLITDVLMPGMTGRDLATTVQAADQYCGILYMSGFTADTGVETGQFPPGSFFLQKPFTLGSLLRKVKEVLAANPRRPERR
ncbi:MAG TPA: response regulator [Bryobacteraceae bacterium]|jgi:hypothetical protein